MLVRFLILETISKMIKCGSSSPKGSGVQVSHLQTFSTDNKQDLREERGEQVCGSAVET